MSNLLDKQRLADVIVKQNRIRSNLPNIYTIFSPDEELQLVEMTRAAWQETDYDFISFKLTFTFSLD